MSRLEGLRKNISRMSRLELAMFHNLDKLETEYKALGENNPIVRAIYTLHIQSIADILWEALDMREPVP